MLCCFHTGVEALGRSAEVVLRRFDFGACYLSRGEVVHATTIRPKSIAHLQHARRVIQFARLIKQFAEQRAPARRAACECDPTLVPISNASRNSRRAVGMSSSYLAAIPAQLCASTLANGPRVPASLRQGS